MKSIHIVVFALIAVVPNVFAQKKVHVAVYYESLCPDSIRFIKNQLEPSYHGFAPFIDIEFIPFGKSKSFSQGNGIDFTCQHGQAECSGNRIHSCALKESLTQAAAVEFVTCQMSFGAESSELCAEQAGLPHEKIADCYSTDDGTQLQLDAEVKTKRLAAPREMLSFVPTIVYNHQYDREKQDQSLVNFVAVLCEEIKSNAYEVPSICANI